MNRAFRQDSRISEKVGRSLVGALFLALAVSGSSNAAEQTQAALQQPAAQAAIERINHYRAMLKLPPARLDPDLSAAAESHARYLLENHVDAIDGELADGAVIEKIRQDEPHHEASNKPFYTAEAAHLAARSIVVGATRVPQPAQVESYIDQLMTKPFDVLVMLNPQIVLYGAGSYCNSAGCRIVMLRQAGMTPAQFGDFYRAGTDVYWFNTSGDRVWFTPRELREPIEFPPAGGRVEPGAFDGSSFPPALRACEGYTAPTGRPIFVALGAPSSSADQVVRLGEYSISSGGKEIAACGYDAQSFYERATSDQSRIAEDKRDKALVEAKLAAQILAQTGAVMVIPREPLAPGGTYDVSITADQRAFKWSFEVAKQSGANQ